MSDGRRPSSQDARLEGVFGGPLDDLHERAVRPGASPALVRALELRVFLALAEAQVVRVRDRVHATMAPDAELDSLSSDALRFDAEWLEAALAARSGYRTALDKLLAAMPPAVRPLAAPAAVRPTVASSNLPPAPAGAGGGVVVRRG
ncbi:hypothetical protein DEJ51_30910 [Streptomyces venezuelae]|uniref:Uncharacterized protein n=1 Tax=Streptomyces venezuelae TaxID=54571 RepID=A0A5P2DV60_STRVZ|nr:hypothetical protein [Streptomyces venezuelae]QES58018.1 hypothetical protein DEJ51_30910 [Streptomyces venezuelae]